ncbi:MAG: hypothetical protein ACRD1F_00845 [Terriglobales bacterium]
MAAATPPKGSLKKVAAAAQAGKLDEAFLLAERQATAHPDDQSLVAARELLRARAVVAHLQPGRALSDAGNHSEAALQYRAALALAPSNAGARAGLAAQYAAQLPPAPSRKPDAIALRVQRAAPPVDLQPTAGRHSFHFRTGLRHAIAQLASAYGLSALVANDVPNGNIHLDVTEANFAQAMTALRAVSGLSWIPLDTHTLYVGTAGELHDLQPFAARTFYLPWLTSTKSLQQMSSVVRSMLGIRDITLDSADQALVIRARPDQLDAAEKLLLDMHGAPGEVLLQIRIVELNATASQALGIAQPSQFTMFALGPLLAQIQQSGGLSQNVLSLFEQGGLNAVLNSGLLSPSALASAQSLLPALLKNPFVIFGGGATLMALTVPNLAASLSAANSRASTLETALLRADSGQKAELRIGERYPVINASFAPISLNPALEKIIGNHSYTEPFPSITYENIGLDAKITPTVGSNGDILLQIDLTSSALAGTNNNNIPIISNRHLTTAVNLRNGDPVLIAGVLNRQEMESLVGLPGLSALPGLAGLFSVKNLQTQNDRLALIVTPHLVRLPVRQSGATWLPSNFSSATGLRGGGN